VACPVCDDVGCIECDKRGRFEITECYQRYCQGIADAIRLADLFKKGLAPIAGGVLDQAAWFVDFAEQQMIEDSKALSESMK
jgi:hypothetical protein